MNDQAQPYGNEKLFSLKEVVMPHILIVDNNLYQHLLIRGIFAADMSFTFSDASNGQMALTQL